MSWFATCCNGQHNLSRNFLVLWYATLCNGPYNWSRNDLVVSRYATLCNGPHNWSRWFGRFMVCYTLHWFAQLVSAQWFGILKIFCTLSSSARKIETCNSIFSCFRQRLLSHFPGITIRAIGFSLLLDSDCGLERNAGTLWSLEKTSLLQNNTIQHNTIHFRCSPLLLTSVVEFPGKNAITSSQWFL